MMELSSAAGQDQVAFCGPAKPSGIKEHLLKASVRARARAHARTHTQSGLVGHCYMASLLI